MFTKLLPVLRRVLHWNLEDGERRRRLWIVKTTDSPQLPAGSCVMMFLNSQSNPGHILPDGGSMSADSDKIVNKVNKALYVRLTEVLIMSQLAKNCLEPVGKFIPVALGDLSLDTF